MAAVSVGLVNKDVLGVDVVRSIPGCALWLDAADASTITQASNRVSTWLDKSGAGNHATAPALNNRPYYSAANSSITFYANATTTNDFCNLMTTALSASIQTESIFFVGRLFADSLFTGNRSVIGSGTHGGRQFVVSTAAGLVKQNVVVIYSTTLVSPGVGNFIMATSVDQGLLVNGLSTTAGYVAGSASMYVNGAFSVTNSTLAGSSSVQYNTGYTSVIGNNINGSAGAGLAYGMCELIVYQAYLTNGQRQAVERYLAKKWNLTLPAAHAYKTAIPYMAPFHPLTIPDCALWIDAVDTRTITLSGSTVTGVLDKSGQANNSTEVSSTITYVTNAINGLPAFRFPGTAAANGYQRIYGPISGANARLTILIVCVITATTNSDARLVSLTPVSQSFDYDNVSSVVTAQVQSQNNVVTTRYNQNMGAFRPFVTGTPFLYTVTFTGYRAFQGTNGTNLAFTTNAGTYGNFAYTRYAIGDTAAVNSKARLIGDVGEVLVYNRGLGNGERAQLENYLAEKWKIPRSSLPATVPFRPYYIPSTPLFLPSLLSSLPSAWFDGGDPNNNPGSIPANGATLATWTDKTGNALNGTGVNSPTYSLSLRAVQFVTASSQYYTTNLTASSATETCFIVAQITQPSPAINHTLLGATSTGGRRIRITNTNFPALLTSGQTYTGSVAVTSGSTFILAVSYNTSASGVTMRLNGTALTIANTTAVTVTAGDTSIIGAATGAGFPMNGFIMETFVYSGTVLGLSVIQRVEGYLAWKWNLNGLLPSTHPYYNIKT